MTQSRSRRERKKEERRKERALYTKIEHKMVGQPAKWSKYIPSRYAATPPSNKMYHPQDEVIEWGETLTYRE